MVWTFCIILYYFFKVVSYIMLTYISAIAFTFKSTSIQEFNKHSCTNLEKPETLWSALFSCDWLLVQSHYIYSDQLHRFYLSNEQNEPRPGKFIYI